MSAQQAGVVLVALCLLPFACCPLPVALCISVALCLLPFATRANFAVLLRQLLHHPPKIPMRIHAFFADKFQLLHLSVAVAFAEQLQLDTEALAEGRPKDVSLAAKWAPTPQGYLTLAFVGFIY
jgi:hypothetical protein